MFQIPYRAKTGPNAYRTESPQWDFAWRDAAIAVGVIVLILPTALSILFN